MAAALSAHSFSFFPVPPADRSNSKSPKILTLASPLHPAASNNLFYAFRRTIRSDFSSRKRGTVLRVASSELKTINHNEESQALENKSKSVAIQNDNMKALIQAYKIHEAVAREESHQIKPGIVTQELRRGFVITDRVLRPASVKVSSGPGLQKPASVATKPMEQPEILTKNTNQ